MRLVVNGRARTLQPEPGETLLETLRDRLHLRGTKAGCEQGECGACTVHINDRPAYSCLALSCGLDGAAVTTIEGIASGDALHPVQAAFVDCDAVQCGYCTPGQVMSVIALLQRHPDPTDEQIREAMAGNLCRCGTYPKIVAAIRQAAVALRAAPAS
ncbi:MAG: (2Fe-2S)-binding protein [Gemmatimonadetes bacterium]|nr:(2Fe-2S)-binding protein [Gemmatimonadota bacterium]